METERKDWPKKTKNHCSIQQSFKRNIVMYIPFIPVVEFFIINSRDDERRWGDRIAGTVVGVGVDT